MPAHIILYLFLISSQSFLGLFICSPILMPSSSDFSQKFNRLGQKIGKVFQPKNKYAPVSQDENAPEEKVPKHVMIHNEAQIEIVQNNVYQNVYPQITERGNHHTEGHGPMLDLFPKDLNLNPLQKLCLGVGAFVLVLAIVIIVQSIVQIIIGVLFLIGLGMSAYEWVKKTVQEEESKKKKVKRGLKDFGNKLIEILDDA